MKNKVLFFGILEDIVGSKELIISESNSSDELLKNIKKQYPELENKTFQIAVNQQIINTNTTLNDGDEIALLPPFAGG
ncbi:MAG: MoaD/ThiS family protein [Flavobacteriales bacterium]|jgi:molybdopterin synthase sulfur carrier subunit|nr:molybdopterin synthase sulfur carrier subunit [Parcubacteria group bacterium]MDP7430737.1 MoaD/ThiS family protein [Flavobacteriales bacterium]HJN63139.1 MoaD/ThiS family protein [Flavobacteriales bacterium]|tara:strand:- start:805 stop:1038 length:234 start_codon:yes stop_codon:yes gene_type:complete